MIVKTPAEIIDSIRATINMTSRSLCDEAKCNAGQYAAWLKGGPLGKEKISSLISVLHPKLEKICNDMLATDKSLAEELEVLVNKINSIEKKRQTIAAISYHLSEIENLQAEYCGSDDLFRNEVYDDMRRDIDRPPKMIKLIGATQSGKTIFLKQLVPKLRDARLHNAWYIDLSKLSSQSEAELLRNIVTQSNMQYGLQRGGIKESGLVEIKKWLDFPKWAVQAWCMEERISTVCLDHCDSLRVELFEKLLLEIHNLTSFRRDHSLLENLNIICALDGASPVNHQLKIAPASIASRYFILKIMPLFSLVEIGHLLTSKTAHQNQGTKFSRLKPDEIYSHSGGNAWLTDRMIREYMAWFTNYSEKIAVGADSANPAEFANYLSNLFVPKVQEDFSQSFIRIPYVDQFRSIFIQNYQGKQPDEVTSIILPTTSEISSYLVDELGLFHYAPGGGVLVKSKTIFLLLNSMLAQNMTEILHYD